MGRAMDIFMVKFQNELPFILIVVAILFVLLWVIPYLARRKKNEQIRNRVA